MVWKQLKFKFPSSNFHPTVKLTELPRLVTSFKLLHRVVVNVKWGVGRLVYAALSFLEEGGIKIY